MDLFSKYYNIPLLSCIIMACIKNKKEINIARLSLLIPMFLDDQIVNRLSHKSEAIKLSNLLNLHQRILSNYNARYYTLLPYIITSLTILLDMNVIIINNGTIINDSNNSFDDLKLKIESQKMQKIINTVDVLLNITENYTTKELFKLLNVQL